MILRWRYNKSKMKYPKPKFKKGDEVVVDNGVKAKILDAGLFRKNGKISWSYQLTSPLYGYWANEDRLKKTKKGGDNNDYQKRNFIKSRT